MLRGYRHFVFALVGWLSLAAAQPEKPRSEPKAAPNQNVAGALDNVAAALQSANKPNRHDEPCQKGGDDRASDLCAQWKAADAARDAADYTNFFGWLGTVIGVLTLAAAGAAAYFAKKAAEHTETGAKEAKRQADLSDQANELTVNSLLPHVHMLGCEINWEKKEINASLKNSGSTPAVNLLFASYDFVLDYPLPGRPNIEPIFLDKFGDWPSGHGQTIYRDLSPINDDDMKAIEAGTKALLFIFFLQYGVRGIDRSAGCRVDVISYGENFKKGTFRLANNGDIKQPPPEGQSEQHPAHSATTPEGAPSTE